MSTSKGSANPNRIEIHYSRFWTGLASLLFLWFVGFNLFWLRGLFSGHLVGVVLGIGAFIALPLILMLFLPTLLHAWTHRAPVVVLDADGVTDVRKKVSHIPWGDIASVELGSGENGAGILAFAFRRADRQRQDLGPAGPLGVLFNRAQTLSDWNVSLRLLSCNSQKVLEQAERLRQQAIRREVVQINRARRSAGDPYQGWSGRL